MDQEGKDNTDTGSPIERFRTLVDRLDTLLYVTDMTTHEILFINACGRRQFGDIAGQLCWKTLQANQSGPCSFCTNDRLVDAEGTPGAPYVWEFQNTVDGRWYECHDQAIPWDNGRLVRLEVATDITARKAAEDELHFTKFAVDHMADGAFWMGADAKFVYVNDAACRALGYSQDELLTMTVHDIDPDFPPEAWAGHWREVKKQRSFTVESHHRRKDGTVLPVEICANFVQFGGKEYNCAFARDISDRKQAEEALRESEAKWRVLMQNIHAGVVVHGPDTQILVSNAVAQDLLGLTVDEMEGKGSSDPEWTLLREDGSVMSVEEYPVSRVLADGKAVRGMLLGIVTRAAESTEWVLTSAEPILDQDGEILQVIVTFMDVTDRKKATEALRESEQRYRNVYNTAPLAFVTWDYACHITGWNDRAERMFGWKEKDILGRNFFEFLVPQEARPQVEQVVADLQAGKIVDRVVNENLTQSGQTLLCEWNNSILYGPDGRPEGAISLGLDITERERAREALREAEERIQHARNLESLGVLGGGIAHDFNNLLTAILGNAEVALLDLPPDSPLAESINDIRKASVRAAQLTKQLLAYSGRGATAIGPLNLGELVAGTETLLPASLVEKVPVVYDLAEDLPLARADAAQIRQAVTNLATNAAEALGEQGGTITIRTGVMTADRACLGQCELGQDMAEGPCVYLEVCDTGCGVEGETRTRLFEPFYTTKFMGRGLGLPAVLGIMRGHHGAIKVDSQPGVGTTVRLLLPQTHEAVRAASEPAQAEPVHSPATGGAILIIDDEKSVRTVTQKILERKGYAVLTAEGGREGIELLRQHTDEIAVVLLDLTMPHMDGPATFTELRRLRNDLPIILCSGYSEVDATSRFVGKGLAGFLKKPFDIDDLTAKLAKLIHP